MPVIRGPRVSGELIAIAVMAGTERSHGDMGEETDAAQRVATRAMSLIRAGSDSEAAWRCCWASPAVSRARSSWPAPGVRGRSTRIPTGVRPASAGYTALE